MLAQPVTKQVERKHRDEQRDARDQDEPRLAVSTVWPWAIMFPQLGGCRDAELRKLSAPSSTIVIPSRAA